MFLLFLSLDTFFAGAAHRRKHIFHASECAAAALRFLRILISKLVMFQSLHHLRDLLQALRHGGHQVRCGDIGELGNGGLVEFAAGRNGDLRGDGFKLAH